MEFTEIPKLVIKCRKCGITNKDIPDSEFHDHHSFLKSLGGTNKDQATIRLCSKCHNILHNMIPMFIWQYIPKDKRAETRKWIEKRTEWWLEK